MNEWDSLIEALPDKKYIDTCALYYRPWIRDKSHLFYAYFNAEAYDYKNDSRSIKPLPKGIPYYMTAFGYTATEAINNLATNLIKFRKEYERTNG